MLLSDWTDVAVGLLVALLVRRVVALGAAFVVARDGSCVLETVLGVFLLWAVDFVFILRVVALGAAFVVARDGNCVLETVLGMFLLWAVDFVLVLLSLGCVVDLSTEDRRFVVSDVDVGSVSDGLIEAAELSVGLSVDC